MHEPRMQIRSACSALSKTGAINSDGDPEKDEKPAAVGLNDFFSRREPEIYALI